jgi:hypothetical protein
MKTKQQKKNDEIYYVFWESEEKMAAPRPSENIKS